MKNEMRFQLAENNGRFEIFLYAQRAAGVSSGRHTVGGLWGACRDSKVCAGLMAR